MKRWKIWGPVVAVLVFAGVAYAAYCSTGYDLVQAVVQASNYESYCQTKKDDAEAGKNSAYNDWNAQTYVTDAAEDTLVSREEDWEDHYTYCGYNCSASYWDSRCGTGQGYWTNLQTAQGVYDTEAAEEAELYSTWQTWISTYNFWSSELDDAEQERIWAENDWINHRGTYGNPNCQQCYDTFFN